MVEELREAKGKPKKPPRRRLDFGSVAEALAAFDATLASGDDGELYRVLGVAVLWLTPGDARHLLARVALKVKAYAAPETPPLSRVCPERFSGGDGF